MSAREWEPGDVAMLKCSDGQERIAILTDRGNLPPLWIASGPEWGRLGEIDVRPLVAIDPEDREAARRLLETYGRQFTGWTPELDSNVTRLQAALREFANPKPPKPAEPTGLSARVIDSSGIEWAKSGRGCWFASRCQADCLAWDSLCDRGPLEVRP